MHYFIIFIRLMPIIEGGTHRVWSRTQDLQLSAEQSYDPNMDLDSQSLLHYHWDCQSTSKVRADKKQNSLSHIKTDKEFSLNWQFLLLTKETTFRLFPH